MARDFNEALKQRKDPLQDIDQTVPGFIPDPSTFTQPTPGGKRRARTFSQTIADATRGIEAGALPSGGKKDDLGSKPGVGTARPDWRGHYDAAQEKPAPRAALQLDTLPPARQVLPPVVHKNQAAGSLYSHRPVTNAQELWDWAKAAGIPNLVPPREMHVTTIYSRQPVDITPRTDTVIAKRNIAPLGDKGALVLHFDSPELQAQHQEARAAGAGHDFPSFLTHVTLSYDTGGQDFTGLAPPTFPLVFGPEVHKPINDNWAEEKGLRKGAFGFPHRHVGGDRLKLPLADRPPKFQPPRTNVKPGVGPERRLFEPQSFRTMRKYSPDQPRDQAGKWAASGGTVQQLAENEFGAFRGKRRVGFLTLHRTAPDEPKEIFQVGVQPSYRGKGAASAMLAAAERVHGQIPPSNALTDDGFEWRRRYRESDVADSLRMPTSRTALMGATATSATNGKTGTIISVGDRVAIAQYHGSDTTFVVPKAQVAHIIGREVTKYSPDQPRDQDGKWTDGGGGPAPDRSASALFDQHHDPSITPAHVLAKAPSEAASTMRDAEDRLARSAKTNDPVEKGGHLQADGTYTPARQALHERILKSIFTDEAVQNATPADGQKPTAIFLGGRGGSGKSWLTGKDGPVDASKAIMLNSDTFKEMLPEYQGWNAALMHDEATDIFNRADEIARGAHLNVIYDATMRTESSSAKRLADLQLAGYDVKGYYMFTAPQEAASRALGRFMRGGKNGRYVPLDVILGSTTNERTFDNIKGSFSDWAIYDNNQLGQAPRLVAKKGGK